MKAPNSIRVLIVDDHAVLRMGLSSLLKSQNGFDVVGEASGGGIALKKARELKPDVVIMDLMMPDMDGIESTRRLILQSPEAKVMILTTFGTSDGISAALEAGALGAIMKNAEPVELIKAIRTVASGQQYLSKEITRIMADEPPVPSLSPRQLEILQSIERGLSNGDIARQLDISVDVVKEHTRILFAKLGAANRAEAVAIALRKHLLKI